ncbi:MAG: ATP synthase F1 subunit epsilon [Flexibacter sp. CG_4_10_14_3_um_filter_32_15]|nr:MAG: ATP synthase F1 subunit epsilon [Flexibacter sp. CG_4_10_14_3_um_filter_32_15]
MFLEIITPDNKTFSGQATSVLVPGSEAKGSFEILDNHSALVSSLQEGKVKIRTQEGKEVFYTISGGVIEVLNNHVIILAESSQIDEFAK